MNKCNTGSRYVLHAIINSFLEDLMSKGLLYVETGTNDNESMCRWWKTRLTPIDVLEYTVSFLWLL